jgi:hypothetical protein
MPDARDLRFRKVGAAPQAPKSPDTEAPPAAPGHLIRGTADYEDLVDRLSKGISVPSDLTHKGKSDDNS